MSRPEKLERGGGSYWPFVSVIVPVFNGGSALICACRCLQNQDYPRDGYEIILVDDGSTDNAIARLSLSHSELIVVRQPRRGSYSARNAGVRAARGTYLAFTDADCLPVDSWIREGVSYMLEHTQKIVAGAVEIVADDLTSAVQRYDCALNIPQAFLVSKVGFGATANLFVRRDLFEQLGGFDGELRSAGDQKFCWTASSKGERVKYVSTAKVRHPARRTVFALVKKTARVARGRARAFPNPGYYFPRVLRLLPPSLYDHRAAQMPPWLRLRFAILHYALEMVRIASYFYGRCGALLRYLRRSIRRGRQP